MSISDYLSDKKAVLLICVGGGLLFTVLLLGFGLSWAELTLLWLCFIAIIFTTAYFEYRSQQKRINYLLSTWDALDQKTLFAEIAKEPENKTEKVYFQLMKTTLKAMTDEVAQSKRETTEYREFIEQWVHEIKVPITGIQLLCENNKNDVMRKVQAQTEQLTQDVERVLYYARLGSAAKDYLIREIPLKECVLEVLTQNKQFLIQNGVTVHTENVTDTVYSDGKWVCFILNQILFNSIKYRSEYQPIIDISSKKLESGVTLSIRDNGIGIKASELGRVFDKGFVGTNGRAGKNSTGIGLYLCDQLCAKLGIELDIQSEPDQYTMVTLYFPKSEFLNL